MAAELEGAAVRDAVHRRADRRQARGGRADRQGALNIIERGGTIDLDPFRITFVPLAHSIPEGNGLLIETPVRQGLPHRRLEDRRDAGARQAGSAGALTAIGDSGVLAMVCEFDQHLPGNGVGLGGERSIAGLLEQVDKAKGRVLVTTFASNAARLETIGRVAVETGRQLCVAGRSLDRILKVARATGYLRDFPETVALRRGDAPAAQRSADRRDRRAGRATRRAGPGGVRQSRTQADRRRHGDFLVQADPRQ